MGGISVLLIERGPGVTTKQMACSGMWASGTAYVTFEDVRVPVENLIGEENQGFKYIVRFTLAHTAIQLSLPELVSNTHRLSAVCATLSNRLLLDGRLSSASFRACCAEANCGCLIVLCCCAVLCSKISIMRSDSSARSHRSTARQRAACGAPLADARLLAHV
jgi:hypothetical protein